jgi:hypothetical protein
MPPFLFQAAVERPLSVVFKDHDGRWIGHDYLVEVITERPDLDRYDVVMDFRDLEAALEAILAKLDHQLLSDLGLCDPLDLAKKLFRDLAPSVPAPARLAEVALTDGRGRRLSIQNA